MVSSRLVARLSAKARLLDGPLSDLSVVDWVGGLRQLSLGAIWFGLFGLWELFGFRCSGFF